MKIKSFEIEGTLYPLNFSTKAYKFLQEELGGFNGLSESLQDTDKIVKTLAVLIEQGAAYKKFYGNDSPIITAEEIEVLTTFKDLPKMKAAIFEAILAGVERTVEVQEEKKTTTQAK